MSDLDHPEDNSPFLRRAVELARLGMLAGEGGPFGAVVVRRGVVLGEGWNRVTSTADPTAHAEIVAIRDACRRVADFRLTGATLYASCEPCPMCWAAAHWARCERIVFAAPAEAAARAGFDDEAIARELRTPPDDRLLPSTLVELDSAIAVLEAWFASDRTRY